MQTIRAAQWTALRVSAFVVPYWKALKSAIWSSLRPAFVCPNESADWAADSPANIKAFG